MTPAPRRPLSQLLALLALGTLCSAAPGYDATLLLDSACLQSGDVALTHAAHAFAALFLDALRFESVLSTYWYMVLVLVGGYASSCPAPKGKVGIALYWTWCACHLLNIISAAIIVLLLGLSVGAFHAAQATCSVPFAGGTLLGWFAALAGPFHPAVLAVMSGVFVGRDLLFVAEHVEGSDVSSSPPVARAIGAMSTVVCIAYALWCGLGVLGFVCSASFAFSIMFAPMSICLAAACALTTAPLFYLTRWGKGATSNRRWLRTLLGVLRNAGSAFKYEADGTWNRVWLGFGALFILSPLPFFGALTALRAYAGLDDPAGTGGTTKLCYDSAFAAFAPPHAVNFPTLDFSQLSDLDFPSLTWDPLKYVQSTAAFFGFTALVNLLKGLASICAYALFALEQLDESPVGISVGRNAIQGVEMRVLVNPLSAKHGQTRHDSQGQLVIVGAGQGTAQRNDALVAACAQGNLDGVREMLAGGASKEATDASGQLPLQAAVSAGEVDVIAFLVGGEAFLAGERKSLDLHNKAISAEGAKALAPALPKLCVCLQLHCYAVPPPVAPDARN